MEPQLKVTVATRWFGVRSQIWSWRQVNRFTRLRPSVVTWAYENQSEFPLGNTQIDTVGFEEEPNDGSKRWLWRLRNLRIRNFYGTQGDEESRIRSILKTQSPNVILAHFGHVALRLLPVAREMGIPVIPHFHGLDISSGLNNRWYRWSIIRAISQFPAIVCVGSKQREKLIELGASEKNISVIPCGVPTSDFPLVQRGDRPDVTFVSVSRLVEWKGVHITISAFARVVSKISGAKLIVVGDGPEHQKLSALVKQLGIEPFVRFEGSRSEGEVRNILEHSDVFVQHSLDHDTGWFEGFGVSVAEASATGMPVIVSACGGLIDQVVDRQTGYIVPQRDEIAMGEAMINLAENSEIRERLGNEGRRRMIELFDTSSQVRKLEEVLLDAALLKGSIASRS